MPSAGKKVSINARFDFSARSPIGTFPGQSRPPWFSFTSSILLTSAPAIYTHQRRHSVHINSGSSYTSIHQPVHIDRCVRSDRIIPSTSKYVPGALFVFVPPWGRGKKEEKLDFSSFSAVGGRNRTRTCGLASLGQVRNSRLASLPLATLLCSPRFRVAFACGEQPTGLTLRFAPPRCFTSRVPQVQSILGNTKEKGPPVGQSFFFGGRNRARRDV